MSSLKNSLVHYFNSELDNLTLRVSMFVIPPHPHTHTHTRTHTRTHTPSPLFQQTVHLLLRSPQRAWDLLTLKTAAVQKAQLLNSFPLVWPKPVARVSGSFTMAPGKCPAGHSLQTFCALSPDLSHGIVQKHNSTIVF